MYLTGHTSKINDWCSNLDSEETLRNLLNLYNMKTQVVFFFFHFEQMKNEKTT